MTRPWLGLLNAVYVALDRNDCQMNTFKEMCNIV